MPRLFYPLDCTATPLALAAQALTVARVQDFARRNNLSTEEREGAYDRAFLLTIPAERMNKILWELDLQPSFRTSGFCFRRISGGALKGLRFSAPE